MSDELVENLLQQAVEALGPEPVTGEVMDHVRQRSVEAERLAVKALIETVRLLHERASDASMLP